MHNVPEQRTRSSGIQVPFSIFDAFIAASDVDETFGDSPYYCEHPDKDPISKLLYDKVKGFDGNSNETAFHAIIPNRQDHGPATTVNRLKVADSRGARRVLEARQGNHVFQ